MIQAHQCKQERVYLSKIQPAGGSICSSIIACHKACKGIQCALGDPLNVQILANWMLMRQEGKPTSFEGLGCLPLLALLQVDLLEHALPEPFDGRIHILGLACLQDTTHQLHNANKRAAVLQNMP